MGITKVALPCTACNITFWRACRHNHPLHPCIAKVTSISRLGELHISNNQVSINLSPNWKDNEMTFEKTRGSGDVVPLTTVIEVALAVVDGHAWVQHCWHGGRHQQQTRDVDVFARATMRPHASTRKWRDEILT
jgi:hypothetical protein